MRKIMRMGIRRRTRMAHMDGAKRDLLLWHSENGRCGAENPYALSMMSQNYAEANDAQQNTFSLWPDNYFIKTTISSAPKASAKVNADHL